MWAAQFSSSGHDVLFKICEFKLGYAFLKESIFLPDPKLDFASPAWQAFIVFAPVLSLRFTFACLSIFAKNNLFLKFEANLFFLASNEVHDSIYELLVGCFVSF